MNGEETQIKPKKERKPQKLPAYLSAEEFAQILKQAKQKHHKLAFILGFHSGMRIGEIVALQKEDIDLNTKRIFIREGKGGKDRVVPLPKGFPQGYLKYIPLRCGIRALQISFKKCCAQSGMNKSDLHFHSLRHSFAVRGMEQGIPLNQIQLLLGHENIATTSVYLKINPKDALESYEKLW